MQVILPLELGRLSSIQISAGLLRAFSARRKMKTRPNYWRVLKNLNGSLSDATAAILPNMAESVSAVLLSEFTLGYLLVTLSNLDIVPIPNCPTLKTIFLVTFSDGSGTTRLYNTMASSLGNFVESAVIDQDIIIEH